jgi:hypothetical protein
LTVRELGDRDGVDSMQREATRLLTRSRSLGLM